MYANLRRPLKPSQPTKPLRQASHCLVTMVIIINSCIDFIIVTVYANKAALFILVFVKANEWISVYQDYQSGQFRKAVDPWTAFNVFGFNITMWSDLLKFRPFWYRNKSPVLYSLSFAYPWVSMYMSTYTSGNFRSGPTSYADTARFRFSIFTFDEEIVIHSPFNKCFKPCEFNHLNSLFYF